MLQNKRVWLVNSVSFKLLVKGSVSVNLYEKIPLGYDVMPTMDYYKAEKKSSNCVFIIFPGGGYDHLASHEGVGYAKLLNTWGIDAFVVNYSLYPKHFPAQLNDARRSIQYVRSRAKEYGIDSNKIVAMGSSAGGHLVSILSTYRGKTEGTFKDEISSENFFPDFQVLCYPVIDLADDKIASKRTPKALLGEEFDKKLAESLSANMIADAFSPPAFIWHNADDKAVNVLNSLEYTKRLKEVNVPTELHVFPYGGHGEGVSVNMHFGQWTTLLFNWLKEMKIY